MTDPKYKLIYFDIKGLGECIKYIFEYKNIEYELETIILFTGEGPWWKIKSEFPFGQLPVLEVGEKKQRLFQSQAICQYLAEEHDLKAGDSFEDAKLVAIANSMQDLILRVAYYYYTREPVQKEKLRVDREEKVLPFYLGRFDEMLQDQDFFFSEKVTWVDFYVVAAIEFVSGMMARDVIGGKFSNLEQLTERIHSFPRVKEYIARRPPYTR